MNATRSSTPHLILVIALAVRLTPPVHADEGFVLNKVASTRSGVAHLACARGLVILQYGPPESAGNPGTLNYAIPLGVAALAMGALSACVQDQK